MLGLDSVVEERGPNDVNGGLSKETKIKIRVVLSVSK